MPSNFLLKAGRTAHRMLLTISGGRLGSEIGGMPLIELITTGRKSGRQHAVMVAAPIVDGDTYVVVGSLRGAPAHPAWFLNLRDNPDALVSVRGGPRRPMTARVATAGERAALWPRVTAAYKGYASDQKKTTREFPLVLLTPAPCPSST